MADFTNEVMSSNFNHGLAYLKNLHWKCFEKKKRKKRDRLEKHRSKPKHVHDVEKQWFNI